MNAKKLGLLGMILVSPLFLKAQKDSTKVYMNLSLTQKEVKIDDKNLFGWTSTFGVPLNKYSNVEFITSFVRDKDPDMTNIETGLYGNLTTNNERKFIASMGAGIKYSDLLYNSKELSKAGKTNEFLPVIRLGTGLKITPEKTLFLNFERDLKNNKNVYSIGLQF